MATLEAAISVFSLRSTSSTSSPSSSSTSLPFTHRGISLSLAAAKCAPVRSRLRSQIRLLCAAQDVAVLEKQQEAAQEEVPGDAAAEEIKRKLFVGNLPWALSVLEIKKLFSDCGTVVDVEFIKQRDGSGKSRGFSFVTMESAEEAQAVIDKFDSTVS
uniref:RRM domain-containing protein n=1 Tax=Kalanchoe fedtschenkoi TaxID=63787 RepID=A0A7N0UW44_KALFE